MPKKAKVKCGASSTAAVYFYPVLLIHGRRLGRTLAFACAIATGFSGVGPSGTRAAARAIEAVAQQEYICPMHPDVRGRAGEKCPRCGMDLVAVSAADYRPYVLDVEFSPRTIEPLQRTRIHFTVRDPHTGARVRRFRLVHERRFHLFVVSQDLDYFAHVHPTLRGDGTLDLDIRLPRAGAYQLIADFLPEGGAPQFVQRSFVTAGYTGSLTDVPCPTVDTGAKLAGDARVSVTMPEPIAGREQLVTFNLQDAATGTPVADLQPYLGATAHLLVVSADLSIAFHSHPVAELSGAAGPDVVFQVLFPRAGTYRMWAQFQRHGQVLTTPFTIVVRDAH